MNLCEIITFCQDKWTEMNLVVRLLLFLFEPVMGLELDVSGFVVLVLDF